MQSSTPALNGMRYTKANHFQFGYDSGGLFCNRSNSHEKFIARYAMPVVCPELDWRQANQAACREIRRDHVGPLWVLLSGGTDSEICLRSFLEAGIEVQAATLRYQSGYNQHDIRFVEKLRRELGFDVLYVDLDVASFFDSSEFYRIADAIQCVSPILVCHLWLANQLDGVPIIAQGEPHLIKKTPDGYVPGVNEYEPGPWYFVESERLCSLYRHFILQNRAAVPGFFQYLPEQVFSYLVKNSFLSQLVSNQVPGKLGTRSSKNLMARQFYSEIEPRPKFTGFEKLAELHDQKRRELADRFPASDQNYYFEYHDLINVLGFSE